MAPRTWRAGNDAHLGDVRHRAEVVEFRVEQHLDRRGDRLKRRGLAGLLLPGRVHAERDDQGRNPPPRPKSSGRGASRERATGLEPATSSLGSAEPDADERTSVNQGLRPCPAGLRRPALGRLLLGTLLRDSAVTKNVTARFRVVSAGQPRPLPAGAGAPPRLLPGVWLPRLVVGCAPRRLLSGARFHPGKVDGRECGSATSTAQCERRTYRAPALSPHDVRPVTRFVGPPAPSWQAPPITHRPALALRLQRRRDFLSALIRRSPSPPDPTETGWTPP